MNISEFLEKSDSVKTSPGQLRNLEFVVGAKLSPQYESYLSNYNGVMPSRRCAISKDRKIETTVHGVYILKESDSTDGLLTAIKSRPIVIQRGYIPIMYDDLGGDFLLNLHNGAIEYYDYGNDDSGIFGESLYDFLKNLREPLEQVDISYLIQHQLIDELSVALDKLEDPNAGVDEVGNSAVCISVFKNVPAVYKFLVYERKLDIGNAKKILKKNMKYFDGFEEMEKIVTQSIVDKENGEI